MAYCAFDSHPINSARLSKLRTLPKTVSSSIRFGNSLTTWSRAPFLKQLVLQVFKKCRYNLESKCSLQCSLVPVPNPVCAFQPCWFKEVGYDVTTSKWCRRAVRYIKARNRNKPDNCWYVDLACLVTCSIHIIHYTTSSSAEELWRQWNATLPHVLYGV